MDRRTRGVHVTPSKPTNPTAHDGRQVAGTAPDSLSIGQCATLACLLEASIPKPGNVHRGADFEDLSLNDFLVSAAAIGPAMDAAAGSDNLGRTVLRAIQATQHLVSSNTNLGIVLLLAPLASVPRDTSVSDGVPQILDELTAEDAHNVYEAIRIAEPGGLGQVDAMDVAHSPPEDLLAAMRQAADRDLIARQYVNRFEDLFSCCVPWLREDLDNGLSLTDSVVHTHVRLMQRFPDTLIARKCGVDVAQTAATRAAAVVNSGQPGDEAYHAALSDLDFWLRSDGHRRNPGTTADFIAAGLFVLLRDGHLKGPSW
jgi:triphosphoribosyl-dephospho-CoA synthase